MSSTHGRSTSANIASFGPSANDDWEKKVVMMLMKVCLEAPQGQSSVDALRDALIAFFPSVLPSMKHKYGKFTAFLKAYSDYFQINPYDRTVRLTSVHPELQAPQKAHHDVTSTYPTAPDHSHPHYYPYSTHTQHGHAMNGTGYSSNSDAPSRSSTASSISSSSSTASRSRNVFHQNQSNVPTPELSASPRGYVPSMASRRSSQQSTSTSSSTASIPVSVASNFPSLGLAGSIGATVVGVSGVNAQGSMSSSMPNAAAHTSAPQKHVSFSSLEQWEQMTVFAVLKLLLFSATGVEHYSALQDRLSDPQLLVKYSNICNLLYLFPGNFKIDDKGYVSLTDPVKARAQYPTLAAEFERRISAPPTIPADTTSPIMIAIRNATSPWEKALLKTIWTTLMGQANHAANFPWLTTQLTKFKPHVKASYGSLRLWAIQQTLFKFQGDTIYIPVHIANAHTLSMNPAAAVNATAHASPASVVGMDPNMLNTASSSSASIIGPSSSTLSTTSSSLSAAAGQPAPHLRSISSSSSSSYASVNSANFSIPVPPALPQRRSGSSVPTSGIGPNVVPSGGGGGGGIGGGIGGIGGGIGGPGTIQVIAAPSSVVIHPSSIPPPPPLSQAPKIVKSRTPGIPARSEPIIYAVDDSSYRRGRSMATGGASGSGSTGGHKRQRSASPTSIRQINPNHAYTPSTGGSGGAFTQPTLSFGGGGPSSSSSGHNRSFSTTDDMMMMSGDSGSAFAQRRESHDGVVLTRVDRSHMPKLQIPQLLSAIPPGGSSTKDAHVFKKGHADGIGSSISASSAAAVASSAFASQPISPRRNPLAILDKEIASLIQVPLSINKTPVSIKPVLNLDDLKKMIQFLTSCSTISVAVELADVSPNSARSNSSSHQQKSSHTSQQEQDQHRRKSSTAGTTPDDSLSPRSMDDRIGGGRGSGNGGGGRSGGGGGGGKSARGSREGGQQAFSAGGLYGTSGGPLSAEMDLSMSPESPSRTGLVVGSAPSQYAASPLDQVGIGSNPSSFTQLSNSAGYLQKGIDISMDSSSGSVSSSSKRRRHHKHSHSRSGSGDGQHPSGSAGHSGTLKRDSTTHAAGHHHHHSNHLHVPGDDSSMAISSSSSSSTTHNRHQHQQHNKSSPHHRSRSGSSPHDEYDDDVVFHADPTTTTVSSSREDIPRIIHDERDEDAASEDEDDRREESSLHHRQEKNQQPQQEQQQHQQQNQQRQQHQSSSSSTPKDITIMCLSARTLHGNSPFAPSCTLQGHDDKNMFKLHPVFVLDLKENPKFYRWLRPLLQSQSVTKIVYNSPKLADVLYTQHGIHLSNIVDIQVLHRFLWEIGTLPLRFQQATGMDIGAGTGNGTGTTEDGYRHGDSNPTSSSSTSSSFILKSPPSKLPFSGVSIGSTGSGGGGGGGNSGGTKGNPSSSTTASASASAPSPASASSSICPKLDVTLGRLLQYFNIQLCGITLAQSHPLFDACVLDYNHTPPLRSGMWPVFSVNPSTIIHVAAACAVLIDLRILLATQLEVTFTKSTLQLSQGYSHMHLPEFQQSHQLHSSLSSSSAHMDALTPLSHDHWMDAPELFSHLSD